MYAPCFCFLNRTIAVPVEDKEVRIRLRVLKEPLTLFGEHNTDRRERLRNLLALLALDNQLDAFNAQFAAHTRKPTKVSTAPEIPPEKAYLVPGTEELRAARLRITAFSLLASKTRLEEERKLAESLYLLPQSIISSDDVTADTKTILSENMNKNSLPPAMTEECKQVRRQFRSNYTQTLQRYSMFRVISSQSASVANKANLSSSFLSEDNGMNDNDNDNDNDDNDFSNPFMGDGGLGLTASRPLGGLAAIPKQPDYVVAGTWSGSLSLLNTTTSRVAHAFQGMSDRITGVAVHPLYEYSNKIASTAAIAACGPEGIALWAAPPVFSHSTSVFQPASSLLSKQSHTVKKELSYDDDEYDMFSDDPMPVMSTPILETSSTKDSKDSYTTSTPLRRLVGHSDRLSRIAWHPMGDHLLSTSYDHTWRFWDIETGQNLSTHLGHTSPVYGVAVHGDGSLVATGDLGGIARLWDIRTGRALFAMEGHSQQVLSASFSPNGFRVATAGGDNTIKIWDLRQRKCEYTIPAHKGLISDVQFEPHHGQMILSSSYDGTVGLYSAYDFSRVAQLIGSEQKVMRACFSSDSSQILSGGYDGTVKVWGVDQNEYSAALEKLLKEEAEQEAQELKKEQSSTVDVKIEDVKQTNEEVPDMED